MFRIAVTRVYVCACVWARSAGPLTAGPVCDAEPWSLLLMRQRSLLPPSHFYFIFLLSLILPSTSCIPLLLIPPPSSSSFHLAPCPSSLHHCFLFVFPQSFFSRLPTPNPPLPSSLLSVLNSKPETPPTFSCILFLSLPSSLLFPLPHFLPPSALHLNNMKINEWKRNENECMHVFEVIVSHSG